MKAFITRNLTENSSFKKRLELEGVFVSGISLLSFAPIPFDSLPMVDWLFFYSKNGVKYFFEQCSLPLPAAMKIATMGPSTATFVVNYGYTPTFIGRGTPETIANAFEQLAKDQKVAFLRAENSKQTIQRALQASIQVIDRVVYCNRPIPFCYLPFFDLLIFTSPLNATTYFQYNTYQPSQTIFSIGPTTTQALQDIGIPNIITAVISSENAVVDLVINHLKSL